MVVSIRPATYRFDERLTSVQHIVQAGRPNGAVDRLHEVNDYLCRVRRRLSTVVLGWPDSRGGATVVVVDLHETAIFRHSFEAKSAVICVSHYPPPIMTHWYELHTL